MWRIVARLRWRARRMPRKSPLTSVIPALSIATSVPVPIAMPTLAAASAGAPLIPSPAPAASRPWGRGRVGPVASHGDDAALGCETADEIAFVVGQHFGAHVGFRNSERFRNRL